MNVFSTTRRKSLEAYYKERDREALTAPTERNPVKEIEMKPDPEPQESEPKQQEPDEHSLPNFMNKPNPPSRHQFGERPKHQFGGSSNYSFGGCILVG